VKHPKNYGILKKKNLVGIVQGDIFQEPFNWDKVLEKGLTIFLVDLEKAKQLREIQKRRDENDSK
jgi:hypothetical protein